MELSIKPDFVPSPGATIPPRANIHDIIDNAIVTASGSIANTGPFDTVSSYSLSYAGSVQYLRGEGVKVGHVTAMSLTGVLYDHLFTKGGVAYWSPGSAPSGARVIQRGMPAFLYPNPGPGAHLFDYEGRLAGKNSPGAADSTLDGDDRYRHIFPVVNGDLRAVEQSAITMTSDGYQLLTNITPFAICRQTTTTVTLQPIEVIFKGPAQALVHASLSRTFDGNDLYCLYYKAGTPVLQYPVSWNGSNISAAHFPHIPWGVIRRVYTESGVTEVTHHRIDDNYTASAEPYYVADVWFWGEPCL